MAEAQRNLDGLTSLISFAGFSIPARARFVAHFVGSTLFTSLTVGLVAGQTGAMLSCGPLLPFMTGSWIGYTWGCIGFWKQSRKKALACANRYPKVMAHGFLTNFDMEVPPTVSMETGEYKEGQQKKQSLEEWICTGGIRRMSYAILTAQSCEEDIAELQKNQRQQLIDGYSRTDS